MADAVKSLMIECGIAMDFVNSVLQFGQNGYRQTDYPKVNLAATQTMINMLQKCERILKACKKDLSENAMKDFISGLEDRWANLMDNIKAWYCKKQRLMFVKTDYGWRGEPRVTIADITEIEVCSLYILHSSQKIIFKT